MNDDVLPRLPGKRRNTWRVGLQQHHRPHDPQIDGWDTHKLRYEPTVDELLANRDALDADIEL